MLSEDDSSKDAKTRIVAVLLGANEHSELEKTNAREIDNAPSVGIDSVAFWFISGSRSRMRADRVTASILRSVVGYNPCIRSDLLSTIRDSFCVSDPEERVSFHFQTTLPASSEFDNSVDVSMAA